MVNKTIMQARLAADIELHKTASDVPYVNFAIIWSDKYKDTERKCFQPCKAWRHTAEFLSKYFKKGVMLVVEGQMITEEWEKDGEKRSRNILLVESAHFCGSKGETGAQNSTQGSQPTDDGFMNIPDGLDEELPFA